jgi:hypothetical protein
MDNDNDDGHETDQGDNDDQSEGESDDQGDDDQGDDDQGDGDEGQSDGLGNDGSGDDEDESEDESEGPVEPAPKRPLKSPRKPSPKKPRKSAIEQAKELKRVKKQQKLLKQQLKLAKLKKHMKKKKSKKSKKRYLSSDSDSESSSSTSSSEEAPPPKRPRKGSAPTQPPPIDQAAMVQQIMEAMSKKLDTFTEASTKAIEERMKHIEALSAGPEADDLPSREVPSLVGSHPSLVPKSVSSGDGSKRPTDKDDDSDDDSQEVRTSMESHRRRRDLIKDSLKNSDMFNFKVPHTSTASSHAQAQFGHSDTPVQTDALVVQQGMLDELKRHAVKRSSKGYKKPDKLLNKMYKPPVAQSKNWSEPPHINRNLFNVVHHAYKHYDIPKKIWTLNPKHQSGKDEKQLLEIIARQQLMIKIINCSTMALVSAQGGVYQVMGEIKKLHSLITDDPDFNLMEWQMAANGILDTSFTTIQEAQVNTADLLRLTADSWFRALEERRRLWLSASRLSSDQQAQLNAVPLNLPSVDLSDPDWGILDTESDTLVKGWSELYLQDRNLSASNLLLKFQTQRNPSAKNVKGQGQGHKTNSKPKKSFPAAASGQESTTGSAQGKSGGGQKYNKGKGYRGKQGKGKGNQKSNPKQ